MNIEVNDIRKAIDAGLNKKSLVFDTDAWLILLDKLEEIEERLNYLESH